jgi:orotate phosphoribosyltransferase
MTTRQELAKKIVDRATLHGEFRLRSGAISNVYFDKYLLESDPVLLREIAEGMAALVPPGIDALAGLEMGGIPVATLLSQATGLPALFVRKAAKTYGTCKLAEGGDAAGRRLLIVEDVVTSGGQILLSARDLRALGARVDAVVCIIDREAGGADNLAAEGLTLLPLFRRAELDVPS